MVGVLVLVLGASGFVAVDGGYLGQSQLSVPYRTIEVFAPESAMRQLIVSYEDTPQTHFSMAIESSPAPHLEAGEVFYGDALLSIAEPLTLRIKRSGSLTITLDRAFSRQEGDRYFIDRPAASFALIPSAPFEALGGNQFRVVDAIASIDVQLQVSGPPIPWPTLGGYQSWGASLVWDAARGRITRFGGGDAFELEPGTFVWDPILGWQQLPIASPPGRVRASLVYDSVRQRLVLFGGLGANGLLADTWEFDGAQWTEVTPPSGPSARWSHGAAFDENSGSMILFLNDAWAWVGGNWQPLPPLPAPPRSSTALAWSPLSGDLFLVGGWDPRGGPRYFEDTWRFDGTAWRMGPALPRSRARLSLVGHPTLGLHVLGGRSGPRNFSAEFALLEPTWQRLRQGERPDRGLVFGQFGVAAQRYAWIRELDDWVAIKRMSPSEQLVGAVANGSEALLFIVADGGLGAWDTTPDRWLPFAPPPFDLLGSLNGNPWLVETDGGLRTLSAQGWTFEGTPPPGLRALTQRSVNEFLTWADDGLSVWTLGTAGLRALGDPLSIDGGVVITGNVFTSIVTGEMGSWILADNGNWVFVGLPRVPELTNRTIVTDAGLALWNTTKVLGSRCQADTECPTQFCVDGRCCESACTGACEACSVAAGGRIDGVCSPAAVTTVCFENECGGKAFCDGQNSVCTTRPPACPVDAGVEPEPEPVQDAGVRPRDAGVRPVIEEPLPPPAGCGCVGSVDALWILAALALARARKRQHPTR